MKRFYDWEMCVNTVRIPHPFSTGLDDAGVVDGDDVEGVRIAVGGDVVVLVAVLDGAEGVQAGRTLLREIVAGSVDVDHVQVGILEDSINTLIWARDHCVRVGGDGDSVGVAAGEAVTGA